MQTGSCEWAEGARVKGDESLCTERKEGSRVPHAPYRPRLRCRHELRVAAVAQLAPALHAAAAQQLPLLSKLRGELFIDCQVAGADCWPRTQQHLPTGDEGDRSG